MNKIKVAISAIWYPMAMATYFWRAFERRKDVELFVVGPFTGSWIPWKGGMHLPEKYVRAPNNPLPSMSINMKVPAAFVKGGLPWTPDLWVQFDAGWHFISRPEGQVVALVETDPHVLKDTYELPKSYSDLTFCMQYSYMKEGEIFLPYAFDPTVHYPMSEIQKIYDVCLLGLHYDTRNGLMNKLSAMKLSVRYGIGEIFDEFRLAYNQSKIAISWSSLLDVPARVFEAMGMGLPLVANRVPDMQLFFTEDEDYLGFDDTEEAIHQVVSLLASDSSRALMAAHGHAKVQSHTWDARVEQILREAKLI